jgi:glutathione S-transferase
MNYSNLITPSFAYLLLSIIFVVLVVFTQSIMVARARLKYKVAAPAIVGNLDFERVFRAHYNTLEQMPMILSLLLIFGLTVDSVVASALGVLWGVARLVYAVGYSKSAKDRHLGSSVSSVITLILLIGSLYGVINIIF